MTAAFARIRSIQSRLAALQPRTARPEALTEVATNLRRPSPPSVAARNAVNFGDLLQAEVSRYATQSLSQSDSSDRRSSLGTGGLASLLGLTAFSNGSGGISNLGSLTAGNGFQPNSLLSNILSSNSLLQRTAVATPQKYNPFRDLEVTSPFGERNLMGGNEDHRGTDYAVKEGTPLPAVGSGEIIRVGEDSVFGREVVYRLDSGEVIQYAHLTSELPFLVTKGQRVNAGDTIGISGATGRSTGPHVHVSVQIAGRYVDSHTFLQGLP